MPNQQKNGKTPSLEKLLKKLPVNISNATTAERLADFISRLDRKKVPTTSFSRMWLLGSLQAKIVFVYIVYWLRSRFHSMDEKQHLKNEAHLETALQMFATMGYLRGAIMKVGQMLANFPEVVPDQFTEVLESLHFEAPPMHYALIREVFLDEFGKEPKQVFASFEHKAFAAASLGQVHRAKLHSGEDVAVKIQYPDIAGTIRTDLRTLRTLLQPLRLGDEWPHLDEKLRDIEQMFLRETNYLQEADYYRQVGLMFARSEQIVVPQVYADFTTTRVLTTEFLPGIHLKAFLATGPSQAERDHFCHLLLVATLRSYYRSHWFFADPHPGNFLLMPDGRLGLIDFGCTREMTEHEWQLGIDMENAFVDNDTTRMDEVIAKSCLFGSAGEMPREHLRLLREFFLWQMEPWGTEGKFDFGDKIFYQRGVNSFMTLMRKGYTRGLPLFLWSNRTIFGYRGLAYKLKGRADFTAIVTQERSE